MAYKWSGSSQNNLNTCDPRLQILLNKVLSVSPFDLTIDEGWRSLEDQNEDKNNGNSNLSIGKHNVILPNGLKNSLAVDVYCYEDKKNGKWAVDGDPEATANAKKLADVILEQAGALGLSVRCGINWSDPYDPAHFELIDNVSEQLFNNYKESVQ